ncbi:MAG: hypothetical protein K6E54_06820 [Bacteroidaceae bacterium]|jgi:hypothetical protein|nr:hypothetical protein [Bacteroidaceae bacterium]
MSQLTQNTTVVRILSFFKLIHRRLRLVKINRNLLVYLTFLAVSIGFWCLQTLKEETFQTINFELEITGTPKNIIFTSEVPKIVKANVNGRGFDFLDHYTRSNGNKISIPFEAFTRKEGKANYDGTALKRLIQRQLNNSLTIQSCSPSNLNLYYSAGKKKRVPVIFGGKARVGLQHVLCDIKVKPDSVDIYAPKHLYDSIHTIYTDRPFYKNVEDTLRRRLALQSIQGVKMVPDSVDITICVDLFTEKSVSVPIYCTNIPSNKVLRTFPSKANVSFHVSATMYNAITEKNFLVVVDYNTIDKDDEKCKVILSGQPSGVSQVKVSPEYVEYIIEQAD